MINKIALNVEQIKLVREIMSFHQAKPVGEAEGAVTQEKHDRYEKGLFRRVELQEAHKVLRNHVANPYFITKNLAAKADHSSAGEPLKNPPAGTAGMYNLARFVAHFEKHPPKVDTPVAAKPTKAKGKKEAAPKKEAVKKPKGKKVKAPAEPAAEPVMEGVEEEMTE